MKLNCAKTALVMCSAILTGMGCSSIAVSKVTLSPSLSPPPPRIAAPLPRFPGSDGKPVSSIATLVKELQTSLTGFTAPGPACEMEVVSDTARVAALVSVAERSIAPAWPTIRSAIADLVQKHPELREIQALRMTAEPGAKTTQLGDRLGWALTESILPRLCRKPLDAEDALALALAIAQISTSSDALYQLSVSTLAELPGADAPFPSSRIPAVAMARRLIEAAVGPKVMAKAPVIVGAQVRVSGPVPLACAQHVSIMASARPGLAQQGSALISGTIVTFALTCENSSETRLTSESLLVANGNDGCLSDASLNGEHVVPELKPGEKRAMTLGPILVSEACASRITLGYDLVSSTIPGRGRLEISVPVLDGRLDVVGVRVDEDVPGSSQKDDVAGLGAGDRAELDLVAQVPDDLRATLNEIESVGGPGESRSTVTLPTRLVRRGPNYGLADDVDIEVVSGRTKANDSWVPGLLMAQDRRATWFRAVVGGQSSCRASAAAFGNLGEAWSAVCDELDAPTFVKLINDSRGAACRLAGEQAQADRDVEDAAAVAERAAATLKNAQEATDGAFGDLQRGISGLLGAPSPVAAPSQAPAAAPGAPLPPAQKSKRMALDLDVVLGVVDPSYSDTAAALALLVQSGGISDADITLAESYIDELMPTTMFHKQSDPDRKAIFREKARQIVANAYVVGLIQRLVGPEAVTPRAVFVAKSTSVLREAGVLVAAALLDYRLKLLSNARKGKAAAEAQYAALSQAVQSFVRVPCEEPLPFIDPGPPTSFYIQRWQSVAAE